MENLKFRVHSPEHSKAIQNRLFELGFRWSVTGKKISHLGTEYLFINEDNIITYCQHKDTFKNSTNKESTLDELYKYDVSFINKNIKELKQKILNLELTGDGIIDILKDIVTKIEKLEIK